MTSKSFKCIICEKEFSSKNAFQQHNKSKHPEKCICPHCNQIFATQKSRDQHITQSHKNVVCTMCKKKFKTKKDLKQHVASLHQNNPTPIKSVLKVNCAYCNKKFKNKDALNQHIISVHMKVKCPHCDKALKNKEGLKQHIANVHEFKCPHCSEKLYSRLLLQRHIESNHKEKIVKSFICHACKKVFKSEDAFKQHSESIKHQIELLESPVCPQCGKEFKMKIDLYNHISQTKHNISPQDIQEETFNCPICEKQFKNSKSLTQHISKKHKESQKEISIKKKGIALFEKRSLKERISCFLRNSLKKKQIVIMDECVGNDVSIIDALADQYDVRQLPQDLLGHSDRDLRLAFKEKNWGLVSKDYEMVMLAREMKLKPVYLLTEKRKHRDLIRISKRNYKVT